LVEYESVGGKYVTRIWNIAGLNSEMATVLRWGRMDKQFIKMSLKDFAWLLLPFGEGGVEVF
jgi:hypothetical protein